MISDFSDLDKIANMKMPFGKFKGMALIDLPEPYVVWFSKQGFPEGELGRLLASFTKLKSMALSIYSSL